MTTAIILLVAALILVGLVGVVLPVLPGVGLIYAGILLYALYFGINTVGKMTLLLLGVITALTFILDYAAAAYGAKKMGASRYGSLGAAIGGLAGFLLFNFPGLIVGIFSGAVAGEMLVAHRDWQASLRSGTGSLVGFLAGTLIKLLVAFSMVITFLIRLWH